MTLDRPEAFGYGRRVTVTGPDGTVSTYELDRWILGFVKGGKVFNHYGYVSWDPRTIKDYVVASGKSGVEILFGIPRVPEYPDQKPDFNYLSVYVDAEGVEKFEQELRAAS